MGSRSWISGDPGNRDQDQWLVRDLSCPRIYTVVCRQRNRAWWDSRVRADEAASQGMVSELLQKMTG